MPRSCEAAHEDSKVEAQRGEKNITKLLVTDPWSKGDYSQHIWEASKAMDGLPEGVPPFGRVPRQLLQAAPILKHRRRRYRGGFAKVRSILGVSTRRAKFGVSGSFRCADFLSDFSGFFGALLMARKPEIQKQQKTATGSWVHWVNRLVQICSKVYESSSKSWQSHTKHAWSKQKL